MRLLISGGGTGGHLMPALAVARALRAEDPAAEILLVGKKGGPEERLVPDAGFAFAGVRVHGFDRDAPAKNFRLLGLPAAFASGIRILDRFKPDVVLGMGGYAMAPAVFAARFRRVPYVLHEKDVKPGLATRMFAAGAAVVCTTLPGTEARLPGVRVEMTGVPIRAGFEPRDPAVPPRRLIVLGGSQGALRLNTAVWSVLDRLLERFEEVIHVAGRQGAEEVDRLRRRGYTGFAFTERIAELMGRADVALSRAGVGAIAELAAVGLPSILVPGDFGGAHQVLNAEAVAGVGGAAVVRDREFSGARLLAELDALTPDRLRAMAAGIRTLARPDAARRVVAVLREVAAVPV
jgi:UDP-N-acetylglucosamine--N-acetylmuramyl-(pentapeptide) pyrophosphoryl-undecaprenol N-acetylglucosamine transferase